MIRSDRAEVDRNVVLVETGDGTYAYHRCTGEMVKLSRAGAALLRSLLTANPTADFGAVMGLSAEKAEQQFYRLQRQLAERGLCQLV